MSTMKADEHFLTSTYNRYLLPTMAGILGGTVMVTIDSMLVGSIVGETGLMTVNLFLPVQLVFSVLGSLVASGGAVLSGQERGRNNAERSRQIMGTSIQLTLVLATLSVSACLIFLRPLTRLLAGSVWSADMIKYARVLILSGLPKTLLYVPVYYLRLDGRNSLSAGLLLCMAGLNIALDLIFMQVMGMGILGSAIACAVSMLTACLLGYYLLLFRGGSFVWPLAASRPPRIMETLKTGSPAALDNLTFAFRILVINALLLRQAGHYIVYFAVITAVSEFALFFINGVPQTAQPILSVYGVEKGNAGIRLLMKRQIVTGLAIGGVFSLVLLVFHREVTALFGVRQDMLFPFLCLASSLLIAQINNIMSGYYTAMNRIGEANLITALRILFLPALFVVFLAAFRPESVWLFLPLSELLTLLIWLGAALAKTVKRPGLSGVLLLDDALEKSGNAIDFTVLNDPEEICLASERITEFCEKNNLTPKQTMRFSLAIEEIMTVMAEKSLDGRGSFDVRAFASEGKITLRIRCAGRQYNPIPLSSSDQDEEAESLLGIKMITGMVKQMLYISTFGVNSFFVQIQ